MRGESEQSDGAFHARGMSWRGLDGVCADRGCAIISDEVFRDYAIEPELDSVLTLRMCVR